MNHPSDLNRDTNILIVDDVEENLKLLSNTLMKAGYRVRPALSGRIALKSALRRPPDLVMLDIRMPELDGLAVCRRLKTDERTADIPVIFISALEGIGDKIEAFEAGGVDFISKPFHEKEILSRVKTHLTLHTMHRHLEALVQHRTQELQNTNRALRLISQSNQLLVQIKSEESLLAKFCSSIIDIGGYPFCWIGTAGNDATNAAIGKLSILEAAWVGDQDLIHLADHERHSTTGPSTRALQRRTSVIIDDLDASAEAEADAWRQAALEQGFSACTALPLVANETSHGTCTIYARSYGAFTPVEVELLRELADNLALGLHMAKERSRRKAAEAALVDSEKRYRTLFESAGDAIFIIEAEGAQAGRIVEANEAAARMHGYAIEALIGKPIDELDTPEHARDVQNKIRRMLDGERIHAKLNHIGRNGLVFPVEVSAGLLEINRRKYILALYRDVSEREKNRAALKDHLAYQSVLAALRALTPASSDQEIINTLLEQTIVQYGLKMAWYGSYAKGCITPSIWAGEKPHPFQGAVLDLTCPDSTDLHHAVSKAVLDRASFGYANLSLQGASSSRFDQALAGRCGSNLAFPIVIDDVVEGGITLYAEVINGFPAERAQRLHLLADELGRTLCEYRARRKLQRELKRLATVVEQSAEGVMITDSASTIRYVNPAFERITGYRRSEVIGRNPGVMKSGRNAGSIYQELWRTIKSGQVWQGRLINKRKDGRLYHEAASISPIFDAEGRASGYVAVKRDITEQLSLESRLRQTQKMEALGTLAGGIAHDFNNILYPIIGYAELILGNMETHPPNHRRVEEILSCAKHANELVNQILAFSRRSKPKLRPLQLQPIIRETIKPFRAFLPPSVELRLELDEACGFVMADPTHIRQIVLNLITNALHAMEETGGCLQVQLRPTELGQEKLSNQEMRPGQYICMSVTDEGMGIDKAVMDKLLDPYFTTKAKGKGTGLGLAVVHGIVTGYGGGVRVRNRMDKGARLDIYFPLSRRRAPMELEPEMDELPMGDERILVVDDEVHNMNLLEDSLCELGYRVSKHAGSLAALAAFREDPDRFDLVVTDFAMPQMNGDRLAKAMLALRPQLPIILCTGFSESFSVAEARAIGIRNYLKKPLSRHTLAQTVRRALDSAAG